MPHTTEPAYPAWLRSAAERFGTPFYGYDLRIVAQRAVRLRESLPAEVALHYALKANAHPAVVRELGSHGYGADVSSVGEIACAAQAGIDADRTLFTGSAKTPAVLARLAGGPPALVVVESVHEARVIGTWAASHHRRQPVLLRINPRRARAVGALALSGASSRFGVDEACALAAWRAIADIPGVLPSGIHVNVESNVIDAGERLAGVVDSARIASELREAGCAIDTIDFGGGLGIPYEAGAYPFDLARFAAGLHELVAAQPARTHWIAEIGRWLVADAGWYASRILDVRQSLGERWVVLDGGIHHLQRTALANANRAMTVLDAGGRPQRLVNVAGCLATPADVLASVIELPDPRCGDLIVIPRCGAYGFSHSMMGFGLHPLPAEVIFDGGSIECMRSDAVVPATDPALGR
ncbi:hypothetical protein GWC77_04055 [Paraburkholderia sp. NMBU_R16]|uniref:hypothetical protein n=1 Tax=Paraburkholderia sp. NMBU_R16 TaxID=2698676 RepID=UPI0015653C1D|nr:hypothetical protein [Paraburkholderia sp. NMBU_R16]NRO95115.1 hypothetical protein [Paraburkholderia sp. NMBU_R16]